MFLEKLEIQGFKSFAQKNVLLFPGISGKDKRGITAVVGPNGSGKSNVADAVRWALGEQSMKTLRGKKSEDVIFSGSDKRGQLGMAEVSLHFNNEDRQAPIDYSQVVLTRRLYRNGDSEYLLNNSRVRLFDVQMLLAKASFGQKTYSVIGQGMVEGFLNTSLAERKEFFDEATGVKQYQIKRDDALNKFKSSYENLLQGEMLINEIEPRMKSLTRQVARLHKRGELELELGQIQMAYYARIWHDLNHGHGEANRFLLELEKEQKQREKKLESINQELEDFKKHNFGANDFSRLQDELSAVQSRRNAIARDLNRLEAQIELKLEAEGKFDLAFMYKKRDELKTEQAKISEELVTLKEKIEEEKSGQSEIFSLRKDLDKKIEELNRQMREVGRYIPEETEPDMMEKIEIVADKISLLQKIDDLGELKIALEEIGKELRSALKSDGARERKDPQINEEWQRLYELLGACNKEREELISRQGERQVVAGGLAERQRLLSEKLNDVKREEQGIESKIKQYSGLLAQSDLEENKISLAESLSQEDAKISRIKEELKKMNQAEDGKRQKLFALQKEAQGLQSELNDLNNRLQRLRVESARYETRLEDLEIEIRAELGSLQDIKRLEPDATIDTVHSRERIAHLKKQLEHIGGIDPTVEEEYNKTKERFDFLTGQIKDLRDTIHSLEKVIKELDVLIKEKFDKEFKEIAKKFEEYFKILFNGGSARITKVMEDAMEEEQAQGVELSEGLTETDKLKKIKFLQKHNSTGLAGIEIKANPPGKRIASVSMLSGGERALTSIALICAIISSNPSPFVVLDEVDAALDEANSERLASILDELSHKTQFIVITHNRASMRKSNILYGVTMGDDGVSKLLSVKLDEIKTKE